MATIELDGVEYSTRKRTNKLRMELQPLLDEKQKAGIEQLRLQTAVQGLSARVANGDMEPGDPEKLAEMLQKLADSTTLGEAVTPKIAAKVLIDADGKPPTVKLLDEHADLDDLEHVVAVALGTASENPTTAPPAES